jgi:hypothetical protein
MGEDLMTDLRIFVGFDGIEGDQGGVATRDATKERTS